MSNAEANIPSKFSTAFTNHRSGEWRLALLLLLLAAEFVHFGIPLLRHLNPTALKWWWPIIGDGRPLAEAAICGTLVAIFLSWPIFRTTFVAALQEADYSRRNYWLRLHLVCVALVGAWLVWGMHQGIFSSLSSASWFLGGIVLLPVTAFTWCAATVDILFWNRWLTKSRSSLIIGSLVGVIARSAGHFAQLLWSPLCQYTFAFVATMLRLFGLPVTSDPSAALIGTARFTVRIGPTCSGLEGIALICVFTSTYLWIYRTKYRFPAALMLIPAGIACIWVLNSLRIAVLIVIGQFYSEIAVTGFHTVAGWVLFNLTAVGLVSVSYHVPWMIRIHDAECRGDYARGSNPAAPYLIPFLLTLGAAMLTAPFSNGFDAAYPARVIVAASALWWYRGRIATSLIELSWSGIVFGGLCFLLWITLTHTDRSADANIGATLHNLPTIGRTAWIFFRIVGAIITAPLVEELAFRGYLLRKLVASNFESLPFDEFSWPSFLISSIAFGALHQSWMAGVSSGIVFALAMYRRGRIADAITAHATANAVLAIYIITTGEWSLWI